MTVVLVHGQPETEAVWGPLVEELSRRGVARDDVVRLSPPGWGAPVPDGWTATMEEYRRWLVGELEEIGRPVDLVGHDWGGAHATHVAMTRPDLLRTWTCDVLGIYEPGYAWHELALVWQTPGRGEADVADMVAHPRERAQGLVALGMRPDIAAEMAGGYTEDMARCILGLFRDAAQPALARIGEDLPTAAARPGLMVHATEDHFTGTEEMRRRAALRAGARFTVLDGVGHWWMVQDPAGGAAALTAFWDEVG